MRPFDLDTYIVNKDLKVRTREGIPVRILCCDLESKTPIVAAVYSRGYKDPVILKYKASGKYMDTYCYLLGGVSDDNFDLFFEDSDYDKIIEKLQRLSGTFVENEMAARRNSLDSELTDIVQNYYNGVADGYARALEDLEILIDSLKKKLEQWV